MKRWEYLTWAGILVICLITGPFSCTLLALQPATGVVRFEGAIDFAAADQIISLLEQARQDPTFGAVVLEI